MQLTGAYGEMHWWIVVIRSVIRYGLGKRRGYVRSFNHTLVWFRTEAVRYTRPWRTPRSYWNNEHYYFKLTGVVCVRC